MTAEAWIPAEEPGGVLSLFVGGRFDAKVMRVANFREDSTPEDYSPLETWGCTADGVIWRRIDAHGAGPDGMSRRFEIAFSLLDDPPRTNDRIMTAMAKALGVLWERRQG